MLKSPASIASGALSLFSSKNISFTYQYCSSIECVYIYSCYIFLLNWPLYHYIVTIFVSSYRFVLKSIFCWYNCSYFCSFLVSNGMEYLFFHQSMCVLWVKCVSCKQYIIQSLLKNSVQPLYVFFKYFKFYFYHSSVAFQV